MIKISLLTYLFWLPLLMLTAQNIDTVKGVYEIGLHSEPYTIITITNQPQDENKIPVILFLHGAGERGNDNTAQLKPGFSTLIKTIEALNLPRCIVIAPQCSANEKWVNTDWTLKSHKMDSVINWPLAIALQILDSLITATRGIDTNRVYVTGLSMGGFGTWDLLQRYPKKFAAAIPICGGGDTSVAYILRDIPIWTFHGAQDKLVPVSRTTDMYNCLKKFGANIQMTIFENTGHLCWDKVYEDKNFISWLFSNIKK